MNGTQVREGAKSKKKGDDHRRIMSTDPDMSDMAILWLADIVKSLIPIFVLHSRTCLLDRARVCCIYWYKVYAAGQNLIPKAIDNSHAPTSPALQVQMDCIHSESRICLAVNLRFGFGSRIE